MFYIFIENMLSHCGKSSTIFTVRYTTNKEYRQAIRDFCNMNTIALEFETDVDDETYDELQFDMDSMKQSMDIIFEMTKDNKYWTILYEKAAAKFFSTHNEIGLSVLFSYDYFSKFVDCWNWFLEGKEFNENTNCYITLLNAL